MAPHDLWRVAPPQAFDCHAFGDDIAVFVMRSADTHVLSPSAGLVLKAMLETAGAEHDADAWLGLALPELPSPPEAAERAACLALLAELERIGLVSKRAAQPSNLQPTAPGP